MFFYFKIQDWSRIGGGDGLCCRPAIRPIMKIFEEKICFLYLTAKILFYGKILIEHFWAFLVLLTLSVQRYNRPTGVQRGGGHFALPPEFGTFQWP